MSNLSRATPREPLFSRATLLVVSFLCCLFVLGATWLLVDRQWTPTLPLPAVLLTLVVVLPVGEFIRQRFRLRLRTILLVMSLFAVLLGVFGAKWNRARIQRRAIKSVKALHARALPPKKVPWSSLAVMPDVGVRYQKGDDVGQDFLKTSNGLIIPAWCVRLLGEDFFFEVDKVSLQRIDLSAPRALDDVELSHFDGLSFWYCRFGSTAIVDIADLKCLRELSLHNCNIQDRDLEVLASLPQLETLSLYNTDVTADGLKQIARITTLKDLMIQELGVRSGELAPLKNLKKLESLSLAGNDRLKIDDMQMLRDLPSLIGVNLSNTGVDENILPLIRELPNLEWAAITPSTPEIGEALKRDEADRDTRPTIYFQ